MKINRRKVVDGALYVGELGVDFCTGYFIGAVAEALTPPAAKPVVKVLIRVGSLGAGLAAAYGLEACRMDLSTLINGAFDAAAKKRELKKMKKELKEQKDEVQKKIEEGIEEIRNQ